MKLISQLEEGFISRDLELLKTVESQADPLTQIFKQARALRLFVEMEANPPSPSLYPEAEAATRKALETPPDSPNLFAILMGMEIYFALFSGRMADAHRLIRFSRSLNPVTLHPEVLLFSLCTEWKFHVFTSQYDQQLKTLKRIFQRKPALKKGSPTWLLAINTRIESALLNRDFVRAQADLEEFKPYQDIQPWQGLGPFNLMKAWYLSLTGKYEEGLDLLESWSLDKMQGRVAPYYRLKSLLLIKNKEFERAEKFLKEIEPQTTLETPSIFALRTTLTQVDYEIFRTMIALANKNLSQARLHAREGIRLTTAHRPYSLRECLRLLFSIELASGSPDSARRILQELDPMNLRMSLEWYRLFLAEKNRPQAMVHFQKFLKENSTEVLKDRLQFAIELSPVDLVDAFTHPVEKTPPSPPPIPTSSPRNIDPLIGKSPQIQEIQIQIQKFASQDATVLVSGETGCGKDIIARSLHDHSSRSQEPFVVVNCGAMSNSLLESELFGHVKGAFTGAHDNHPGLFETAGNGTLFLDEISSMSEHLQAALLRVLENHEIRPVGGNRIKKTNARVIAATNEPLDQLVHSGRFRKDLFFRLARLQINIPPLRDRPTDIPLLARHFLSKFSDTLTLSDELITSLMEYSWPGNVRELKNDIERMALTAGNQTILPASLFEPVQFPPNPNLWPSESIPNSPTPAPPSAGDLEPPSYKNFRSRQILDFLQENKRVTRGDVIRILGCSPITAANDLKKLEQDGKIQRIQPTSYARTSYFVAAGKSF